MSKSFIYLEISNLELAPTGKYRVFEIGEWNLLTEVRRTKVRQTKFANQGLRKLEFNNLENFNFGKMGNSVLKALVFSKFVPGQSQPRQQAFYLEYFPGQTPRGFKPAKFKTGFAKNLKPL